MTTPLVAVVYLVVIVFRAWSTPVEEVAWVVPMIWALGAVVGVVVIASIAAAIAAGVSSEVREAARDAVRAQVVAEVAGDRSPDVSAEVAAAASTVKATRPHPVEADERDKQIAARRTPGGPVGPAVSPLCHG
jgi:hypothetical protein